MGSDDKLSGVFRLIGYYRQLLLFGVPGMCSLLAGVAWGVWVVDVFLRKHALFVGSAMVSVLLAIIGALALFTGTILHSVRGLLVDLARPGERLAHRSSGSCQGLRFVRRQPLIWFGGPGTILLLAGVAWGTRVVAIMRGTRELAMGSALICMLLSIVGSLGILAGLILHSVRGLLLDLARTRRRK
jgi:hypothetical protein